MALERWGDQGEVEAHRAERKRLSENHYNRGHSLTAWLLATLVGVNGTAAAAILTRGGEVPDGGRLPAIAFVAGIVLAIISRFFASAEARDKSGLYYIESLRPDQLSSEGEKKKRLWERRGKVLGVIARLTNYASLAAFVLGAAWVAGTYS
jgi:hypothetical protein